MPEKAEKAEKESGRWHLEKTYQALVSDSNAVGTSFNAYLLLASIAAILIFGETPDAKVLGISLARLPAAGIALVLACAAQFRFCVLQRACTATEYRLKSLRIVVFGHAARRVDWDRAIPSHLLTAMESLLNARHRLDRCLAAISLIVVGLLLLCAPVVCMVAFVGEARGALGWWAAPVPILSALFLLGAWAAILAPMFRPILWVGAYPPEDSPSEPPSGPSVTSHQD